MLLLINKVHIPGKVILRYTLEDFTAVLLSFGLFHMTQKSVIYFSNQLVGNSHLLEELVNNGLHLCVIVRSRFYIIQHCIMNGLKTIDILDGDIRLVSKKKTNHLDHNEIEILPPNCCIDRQYA